MRRSFHILCNAVWIAALLWAAAPHVVAADYWVPFSSPGVVTNNDCGFVAAAEGGILVRRSFHSDATDGTRAHVADRLYSGDGLSVPLNGRLEWVSGNNIVVVLGSDARATLGGLRTFTDAGGNKVLRLDLKLIQGECRVQVRLNELRPEAVLVSLGDEIEVLVQRGDVELAAGGSWRVASLSGSVQARIKRGTVTGAPFTIGEGTAVDGTGEKGLDAQELASAQRRLPFSFELVSAALPPLPAMSRMLEAP